MEDVQPSAEHQRLADLIEEKSHSFATGNEEIQLAALAATKATFDSALSQEKVGFESIKEFVRSIVALEPRETRSQKRTREETEKEGSKGEPKSKPNPMLEAVDNLEPTPLAGLFLDGMHPDQIWSQLELRAKNVCNLVDLVFEGEYPDPEALEKESPVEEESDAEEDEMDLDYEDDTWMANGEDEEDAAESSGSEDLGEHFAPLRPVRVNPNEQHAQRKLDLDRPSSQQNGKNGKETKKQRNKNRHPTLDNDFFSISEFNREIDAAEAKSSSRGRLNDDSGSEGEGSIDLFEDVNQEEVSYEMDEDDEHATLMYNDFFDLPAGISAPKKAKERQKPKESTEDTSKPSRESKVRFHEEVRVKLIKSRRNPLSLMHLYDEEEEGEEDEDPLNSFADSWGDEDDEDDTADEEEEEGEDNDDEEEDDENTETEQEEEGFDAIEGTKDDLFADEEEPTSDVSAFAQRQLALKKQIEELEQENIGEKDWTLMGEATSRSRPLNSLLEEDLEFEHAQRPAPVITEEKVKSIEDLIKARIIENRFDDVVRRRAIDDKPFLPSKVFELQDTKSTQSLAQIYEDEYTAAKTGGTADKRDAKLQKEHEDLEKLWENIAGKLDALCNAHFTPKAPKGVISTLANVSSTSIESALPTVKSVSSMLAPEEVFSTALPGVSASKGELTPKEKKAMRLKQKKSRAKLRARLDSTVDKFAKMKKGDLNGANGNVGSKGKGRKAKEKQEKAAALQSVVKSGKGVTVVGKASKTKAKK